MPVGIFWSSSLSTAVCKKAVTALSFRSSPSVPCASCFSVLAFPTAFRAPRLQHLFLPTLLFTIRFSVPTNPIFPPSFRSLCAMSLPRMSETLQVKRLSQHAVLPVRGSEWAAGYDLASAEDTVVPAKGKALVKTDLSIAIPPNTYARIAPRSGLAWKKHIDVGAGVVDYDYRGPVGVVLFNHGTEDFGVSRGDRVAQLILERISMAAVVEVEEGGELPETKRGQGGFGSTGVRHQGQLAEREEGGNGEGKRMRVVEGATSVPTGAQLLLMLKEVADSGEDKDWIKSLKPLALAGDTRMYAAWGAYQCNKDMSDLKETLRLITPSEQ